MRVKIWQGANQIGGNCIEVATGRTRIVLDAGVPLDELEERRASGGQVEEPPPVPGLFAPGDPVDGVFLSHAHADHYALLDSMSYDVPVWMTKDTSKTLMALRLFVERQCRAADYEICVMEPHMPFRVGDMTLTVLPVDHSIAGAAGLLIESEGKRVVYSGDLRLHSRDASWQGWIDRLGTDGGVDALITEGTLYGRAKRVTRTEDDVESLIVEFMSGRKGLGLARFSPTNLDRFLSIHRASRRLNRRLVVDLYGAFLHHLLRPRGIRRAEIGFLSPPKRQEGLAKKIRTYEASVVSTQELLAEPHRYMIAFRPWMLDALFERALPPDSACVFSYWSGYLKQDCERELQTTLDQFECPTKALHSGGHITPDDLERFIAKLNTDAIIPVHTEAAAKLKREFSQAVLLENNESTEV